MRQRSDRPLTPIQRLFIAGELGQFEHSVLAGDESGMIAILIKVELSPSRAKEYAREILDNPRKFGYCKGGCLI